MNSWIAAACSTLQQQGLRPGAPQLDADLMIFCLNKACQQRCKVLLNDVLLHLPVLHATIWLVLSSLVSCLQDCLKAAWQCICQPDQQQNPL